MNNIVRTLIVLSFFALLPFCVTAQTKKDDISLSYAHGILPSCILLDYIIPGGGSHGTVITHSTGANVISGKWQLSKSFSLGLSFGHRYAVGYNFDSDPSYNKNFGYRCTNLTLDAAYSYEIDENISLYAAVAAGRSTINGHEQTRSYGRSYVYNGLALQLTPIGVRFGRRLGGFVEVGLGYKGLVSGGISYVVVRPKPRPALPKWSDNDE